MKYQTHVIPQILFITRCDGDELTRKYIYTKLIDEKVHKLLIVTFFLRDSGDNTVGW